MLDIKTKKFQNLRLPHPTYMHIAVWISAGIAGLLAVAYAKLIASTQDLFFQFFDSHARLISVVTPLFFVLATWIVKRFAPEAKGSGIPQVLQAIEQSRDKDRGQEAWISPLVSLKTAGFKVVSSTLGILGGASIGREGPTVQIAASVFAWVGFRIKKRFPGIDFHSFLIAGAAAGVAAAFNTPLAGITFALEEIADGMFGPFRQIVMLAVIIAGITAQAFQGDYLYFGHPSLDSANLLVVPQALLIGIVGGLFGSLFAKLLAFPSLSRLPTKWWPRALACGAVCSLIGFFTHGATAGSGYEATRSTLESDQIQNVFVLFPVWKLVTTVLSYLSGMAGGIFSPCLSIGAGLGLSIAKLAHFANFKVCALLGMVAFFSGVVQAPLTAVIIVMEMTDEHILILPFMIAAFLAQSIGRRFMPVPLYPFLAGHAAVSAPTSEQH